MKRLLLVALAAALAAAGAGWWMLEQPYAAFAGDLLLDVLPGTRTRALARQLRDAGVVRSEWHFLAARALRPRARIQAGEYRFHTAASARQVLDRLISGDVFYHELVVPEGHNMFDIAASLDALGVIGGAAFLKAARDPSMIRDLAAAAPSLEGYLFPSTYRVTRRTTAEQLCRLMTGQFRKAWAQAAAGAPVDVHQIVTLASLVEKETSVPEERPLVAAVYRNRLLRHIRLQCDPTTIYAALLEGRYRGAIYRSDLDADHPYNTYRTPGLPPGPIASPGLAALQAALRPAESEYLFFVARGDGSGGHRFSTRLGEHERAVAEYRRARQKAETR